MSTSGPEPFHDRLVSASPRETSGPRSANRFAYQGSFGICLTLKLHEGADDYCVLFDVHDDIVALNAALAPTRAKFYQVKSKATGRWTPLALTKRAAGKTGPLPSMLGKLYDHRIRFSTGAERLTFVSNARYELKLADGTISNDHDSIGIDKLEAADLAEICTKIKEEHSLTAEPEGLDSTFLETTSLSLKDHETHCEGVVSTFLSKQGDGTIPPGPFHRALRAEVLRRSNKEGLAATFDDLVGQRGITRKQLQGMIDSVVSQRKQDDLIGLLQPQIVAEGFPLGQRLTLIDEARNFLAKRLDLSNMFLAEAAEKVTAELSAGPAELLSSPRPLADAITYLAGRNQKAWQAVRDRYSEDFLHAMFAVLRYEHKQLPPTGSQSAEKNS